MNISMKVLLIFAFALAVSPPIGCQRDEAVIDGLLPASGEITGWSRGGESLRYGPEDLWEYINGAAENFLAYGFEQVVAQDYRREDGRELKVDIYRLGNPLMAFGIYSQLRGPDLNYLPIGAEGFCDPYSLHFWKDSYYVKVAMYEESEELSAVMERFAEAIAGKIPGKGAFPEEIACFPEEGLVEKSVTYIAEGVLGSGEFPPSFAAEYMIGEGEGMLYLSPLGSEERAKEVLVWYAGKLGAGIREYDEPAGRFTAATGNDPYRGETAVFQSGAWVGVLTGFGEAAERETLIRAAVASIARQAGGTVD